MKNKESSTGAPQQYTQQNVKSHGVSAADKAIWVVILIAAAAACISAAMGWLGPWMGASIGDMVWGVIFIVIILFSLRRFFWVGVFFPLAFLAMIFDKVLFSERFFDGKDLPFWPLMGGALFLSIAFHILFSGRKRRKKRMENRNFINVKFAGAGGAYYGGTQSAGTARGYENAGKGTAYEYGSENAGAAGDGTAYEYGSENAGGAGAGYNGSDAFSRGADSLSGSFVRAEASLSNTIKYVNSEALKRAELENYFASMDVYFDNAKVADGNALIVVSVSFGAMNLYVPSDWNITIAVDSSFSNTEENNIPPQGTVKTANIMLIGEVSFGRLVITYV